MNKLRVPFLSDKKGVSYTISAIVITATTITLVLVASIYAYQVLERQRGVAEFDVAKESILAFNDALENIAWKPGSARSSRFIVKYGQLELIPGDGTQSETELEVEAKIKDSPDGNITVKQKYSDSNSTGFVRYRIKNQYITFGEGYQTYLLGDENFILVDSTGSYGRAIIEQKSSWVSITLNYRVRVLKTSVITSEGAVNYISFYIIKLTMTNTNIVEQVGDFDLKAKTLSVKMSTSTPYNLTDSNGDGFADQTIKVEVEFESEVRGEEIEIEQEINISQLVTTNGSGKVIFDFITAEMLISV